MKPGFFTNYNLSPPHAFKHAYCRDLMQDLMKRQKPILSATLITLDVCEAVPSSPFKGYLSLLMLFL